MKMASFMKLYGDDFHLNQDIMQTIQSQVVFCICCLKKNVPYLNLLTCTHADFLNSIAVLELKPVNQVVCHQCHEMLKKIKLFKLQVEDSFKLLVAQENIPEVCNQRRNILTEAHGIVNIDIPQTDSKESYQQTISKQNHKNNKTKTNSEFGYKQTKQNTAKSNPPKSMKDKKIKNIEHALKIINSNNINNDCINLLTTSLQSIAGTQLTSLTNALLKSYKKTPMDFKMANNSISKGDTEKFSGISNFSNLITNKSKDTHSLTKIYDSIPNHTVVSQKVKDSTKVPVKVDSNDVEAVFNNPIMLNKTTEILDDTKMLTEATKDTMMNENIHKDETNLPVTVIMESDDITAVSNNPIMLNKTTEILDDAKMLIETTKDTMMNENIHKDETNLPVTVILESDDITAVSNNPIMVNKTKSIPDDAKMLIEATKDTMMNENIFKDETNLAMTVILDSDDITAVSNNPIMLNETTDIPDDAKMLIEVSNDIIMTENNQNDERNFPGKVILESDGFTGVSNDMVMLNNDNNKMLIENTNFSNDMIRNEITNIDVFEEDIQLSEINTTASTEAVNDSNVLISEPPINETQVKLSTNLKIVNITKEELMEERYIAAKSKLYTGSVYRCTSCVLAFNYEENYDDHMKRKHTPKHDSRVCDVCLQVLHPPGSYSLHTYHHYTRLECCSCSKRFGLHEKAAAIYHYKRQHANLEKCHLCPYMTHDKHKFNIHMIRKHRFSCNVCGVRFNSSRKLETHTNSTHGESTRDYVKQPSNVTAPTKSKKSSRRRKVDVSRREDDRRELT